MAVVGGESPLEGGAGGRGRWGSVEVLSSAEVWDSTTELWSSLPPMNHPRARAAGCLLPSGSFCVVGGIGPPGPAHHGDEVGQSDAEAWDGESWQTLPGMHEPSGGGRAMAVRGGMLRVGGKRSRWPIECSAQPELYDECLRRWLRLPYKVVLPYKVDQRRKILTKLSGMDGCGGFTVERRLCE